MPYVTREQRDALNAGAAPANCGELNFVLTTKILQSENMPADKIHDLKEDLKATLRAYLNGAKPMRYQTVNDAMGAAWCAVTELDSRSSGNFRVQKLLLVVAARELYQEIARPYEDLKIAENGDLPFPPPKATAIGVKQ